MDLSPEQIDQNINRMKDIRNQLTQTKRNDDAMTITELIRLKEEAKMLSEQTLSALDDIMESFDYSDAQ